MNENKKIYLDYHATTPALPEVREAMSPYFCEHFGNSSSNHEWGWKAEMAMQKATKQVADLVGAKASQVYFTSGATESVHWALIGWAKKNSGGKIITTNAEHKCVYGALSWVEHFNVEFVQVGVDNYGQINLDQLKSHLGQKPTLVSFIHGNNEIGTTNPVEKITELCSQFENTQIHMDAAQSVGKIPVKFAQWNLDYLSFSGHKFYAPKGIGGLIIKDKDNLSPLFIGGGQQKGMRAGTVNVPAAVGLGVASQWCQENMEAETQRLSSLRDFMIEKLISTGKVKLNGHPTERLSYNMNFTFADLTPDKLLLKLPNVGFSSGSACSSTKPEPSHVLKAIGHSDDEARRSLRFGIGHSTTKEEIELVTQQICSALEEAKNWLS